MPPRNGLPGTWSPTSSTPDDGTLHRLCLQPIAAPRGAEPTVMSASRLALRVSPGGSRNGGSRAVQRGGADDGVRSMGALALLLPALLPAAARAHVPDTGPAGPALQWNTEPWLLAPMAASLLLYLRGVWRLWSHAGWGRGISPRAVLAFACGWLALGVALVSPLDALGGRLFSAHMVQHELLMVVAAPLLVLGRPLAAWTWAFGARGRQRIGRIAGASWMAAPWSVLTEPTVAWALHALALWVWHVPAFFDGALRHEGLHVLQHGSFLASALFFWWTALGRDPRGVQGTGQAVGSLFTTMLHTGALGALLTLSPTPWYTVYLPATAGLGIDALEDQQLGGLVMWVPSGLAYLVAALALLGRLLTRQRA